MKTKYYTDQDAQRALVFIWQNDPNVRINDLHIYICPRCSHFHVGHVRRKAERVKEK
jgi:hypothetical protein